jgi:hypothetical protein
LIKRKTAELMKRDTNELVKIARTSGLSDDAIKATRMKGAGKAGLAALVAYLFYQGLSGGGEEEPSEVENLVADLRREQDARDTGGSIKRSPWSSGRFPKEEEEGEGEIPAYAASPLLDYKAALEEEDLSPGGMAGRGLREAIGAGAGAVGEVAGPVVESLGDFAGELFTPRRARRSPRDPFRAAPRSTPGLLPSDQRREALGFSLQERRLARS